MGYLYNVNVALASVTDRDIPRVALSHADKHYPLTLSSVLRLSEVLLSSALAFLFSRLNPPRFREL